MEVFSGTVLTEDGFIEGYVRTDDGKIIEITEGKCPFDNDIKGLIVPSMVNSHTHCADGGLKVAPGLSLEDLVAPPNGLKHKYLRDLSDAFLIDTMKKYSTASRRNGIGTFIDFREGGIAGCELLRKASPEAIILGRPAFGGYDAEEIDGILKVADGIGLPSISDMRFEDIEAIADHVRRSNGMFSIHVSERIREDIDAALSLDPAFIIHMVESTDSDITKCAEAEVPIVVCARSNLYFEKVPPIKRMVDMGADVAIGTDNAMFCEPDLRAEASVFLEVLSSQGGSPHDIIDPLFLQGRKILYPANKIHLYEGADAMLTVFPYSGEFSIEKALADRGRIIGRTVVSKEGMQ